MPLRLLSFKQNLLKDVYDILLDGFLGTSQGLQKVCMGLIWPEADMICTYIRNDKTKTNMRQHGLIWRPEHVHEIRHGSFLMTEMKF